MPVMLGTNAMIQLWMNKDALPTQAEIEAEKKKREKAVKDGQVIKK